MTGPELQRFPDRKPPLDQSPALLAQRHHVWFDSTMCNFGIHSDQLWRVPDRFAAVF